MKVGKYLSVFVVLSLAFIFVSKVSLAKDGVDTTVTTSATVSTESPKASSTPNTTVTIRTPEPSSTPKTEKDSFRLFGDRSEQKETPEPKESPRVKGEDRLEAKRLEFCEKHQDEIEKRSDSLMALVSNMLGKFDAIATKVEDFYKNKVVPSGKTVPNYDALVADIASKKVAVSTALNNSQADVAGFTCTGANPKGQITLFRTDMQAVKTALHDYRTAIKNLIVAVRGVVGEGEEGSPKPSATPAPSVAPTATPTAAPTATPVATATP